MCTALKDLETPVMLFIIAYLRALKDDAIYFLRLYSHVPFRKILI